VTIGLGVGTFLLVVNDDHSSILHGHGDTGLQKFWGYEFDLLGSRDVIGHKIIGLSICGFLLVVHCNHASILHRYIDMRPQRHWGHDFYLLGSRDVIDHVTIGLGVNTFLLVVIIGLGTCCFPLVVHFTYLFTCQMVATSVECFKQDVTIDRRQTTDRQTTLRRNV